MKRKNTITEMKDKPEIRLINRFIEQAGFSVGDKIIVTYQENKITIEKELPAKVKDSSSQQHKLF
jgi:hypothetical protein